MADAGEQQTVFLVDDDASTLYVLELVLRQAGHTVVSFDSPSAFLAAVPEDAAGCVLLDLHMPEMDGLAVQAALHRAGATLPVVFLSSVAKVPDAVQAMKGGAVDFLSKPASAKELNTVVVRALEYDRTARAQRRERAARRERFGTLTAQEQKVARLVAQGLASKQIADTLGIADQTIRVYRSRIAQKLRVGSVAELVHFLAQLDTSSEQTR